MGRVSVVALREKVTLAIAKQKADLKVLIGSTSPQETAVRMRIRERVELLEAFLDALNGDNMMLNLYNLDFSKEVFPESDSALIHDSTNEFEAFYS